MAPFLFPSLRSLRPDLLKLGVEVLETRSIMDSSHSAGKSRISRDPHTNSWVLNKASWPACHRLLSHVSFQQYIQFIQNTLEYKGSRDNSSWELMPLGPFQLILLPHTVLMFMPCLMISNSLPVSVIKSLLINNFMLAYTFYSGTSGFKFDRGGRQMGLNEKKLTHTHARMWNHAYILRPFKLLYVFAEI